MPSKLRMPLLSGALVCVLLAQGCSSFDLKKDIPWPLGDVDDPKAPTKVVAVWTDTVLTRVGRPSQRGFGGRLMFYNSADDAPVKVDGTLIVYAFDEEGRKSADFKPDRKYVFTREQFPAHYSKSKIGHSYSVWVPWDEVGGPMRQISLIVRFTPVAGSVVVSEQARQMLPGIPPQEEGPAPSQARQAPLRPVGHSAVRPVSYDAEAADRPEEDQQRAEGGQNEARQKKTTTTIDVPPRFGQGTPVATPRAGTIPAQGGRRDSAARTALSPLGEPARQASQARQPVPPRELPPSQTPARPAVRSLLGGPRAPGGPVAPRALDRAPFEPRPAGSQSRPQTRPGWAKASQYGSISPAASPALTSNLVVIPLPLSRPPTFSR